MKSKTKKMTIFEKIELVEAAAKLAEFFEMLPSELVGASAYSKNKTDEWNKIVREVEKFYELPYKERIKFINKK